MNYTANTVVPENSTSSGGGKQKRICRTRINGTELNTTELIN